MANPYEQFAPANAVLAPAKLNPCAQFAVPAAAAVPPPAEPSTALDALQSFGSGAVRGAVETAMLPVIINRLAESGADWLFDKGDSLVRTIFGAEQRTPDRKAEIEKLKNGFTGEQLNDLIFGGQDAARRGLDSVLHKPKTTTGEYARTIGEFAAPGALPGRAVRSAPNIAGRTGEYVGDLIGNVVMPAIASETAGQIAEGTAAEPWARAAGGVGGAALTAAGRAWNAPEMAVRRATGELTPQQWDEALNLQNNPTGVALTGPEAIAQATGGATALPNLLRVVEGSTEGRVATAPFFAQRPDQVDAAVGNVLDQIAPQSTAPSTLGPRIAGAAERAIAQSPEGQALSDAIFDAGPRTTALQAGEVIQPELRKTFDGREGMRNALADNDYTAARRAEPTVPVEGLEPVTTTVQPAYTSIRPVAADGDVPAAMTPVAVEAKLETPALTSRTGPDFIQVDARPVVQFIDDMIPNARAGTQDALRSVRGMLFDRGGVDTGVNGLDAARGQIGDIINAAKNNGQTQQAAMLLRVQQQLDGALATAPEYASARRNFQNASEPLDPFKSPGMSNTISRDEFNKQFATPPEQVPGALSTPSEARNFNAVASPEARTAMENRVATQMLDKATDGAGNVSTERLASVLRDSEDLLAQFPGVGERLQAVADASAGMQGARTGAVGRVAAADGTQAAGEALLPRNPMAGSAREQGDAAALLVAQDDAATRGTVRQNLGDRYSKASTGTQEGVREFTGTKFHKDVAGNREREEVLDAVMRALPGAPADEMNMLLDVLAATGRRKPIGSATAFNSATMNNELGANSPLAALFGTVRAAGTNMLTQAGDATKRLALRRNIGALADLFTDPQSVELIRQAGERGAAINFGELLPRTAGQVSPLFREERQ